MIYLKSHSKCLGLCWGSSCGLANGKDEHKLSVDFKDVFISVKVVLSAVASIIPATAAAEFLPRISRLFLAPFNMKKNHVVLLSSLEILVSVPIFPVLINLFTSLCQSIPDLMILAGSASRSLFRAEQH